MELAPEAAGALGIQEDDWVWMKTARGRIRQKAKLTPGLDPRVVCAAYGWWFPERGDKELFGCKEANLNVPTDMRPPYNPVLASVNLRCIPCSLERGT